MALDRAQRNDIAHHYAHRGHQWYARWKLACDPAYDAVDPLLRGSSLLTYSESGYGYAVEKAGDTRGWTHTIYEETWNYGFPQEMAHFVDCVLHDREPLVTAADGRVVLEAVYAAYRSAGTGQRVTFPLQLSEAERAASPIELWRAPAPA